MPWISSYSLLSKLKDGRVNGENLLLPMKCSESDFIFTITFLIPCTRFSDSAKHLSNALNSHRISEYAKKCVIESVCV